MQDSYFVNQRHKCVKIALINIFVCLYAIILAILIKAQIIYCWSFIFLGIVLLLFIYIIKLFGSFGIYIIENKVFYKRFKKKQIDVNSIIGIKVIKSEIQTDLAWSPIDLKDKQGNRLYSAIYLSKIDSHMKNYPYGDIEFIRKYKNDIIMYSIYDKVMIDYLKQINDKIEIF